jgi:predicted DsbA family dithiol-disulfide isomerase
MSEERNRCNDQTCTEATPSQPADATPRRSSPAALTIEVISDVICPWCFIGKRRLEKALSLLKNPTSVKVMWKPFQLNPQMPARGIERRAYRMAKFGSWEQSLALDAKVAEAGKGEGIDFAFDRMSRTPNTLDAHRLIWLAQEVGVQDAVVETLFRAYFLDGLDLNDRSTLLALAVQSGITAPEAERLLAGDEGRAEVLKEEAQYKSLGVSGVPSFFFNGEFAFSGAVDGSLLADAIRQVLPFPQ